MADKHSREDFSMSGVSSETSESMLELNIKTLDSQIHSFHVDKNILVSSFKDKISNKISVPAGQQRLIFRGKVLKDDHLLSEYHVETGDTLHLVIRQSQATSSSSVEANENNVNQGNDASAAGPRSRIGQIAHSVVLGSFNVGEQGENVVPDLGRVIGAVLNSIGIGNQTGQPSTHSNDSGQVPQGNETGAHGTAGVQNQTGNQSQGPQHGVPLQAPFPGLAVPLPTLQTPIPDSLNTLSEFMNRMELSFSHTENQANTSELSTVELPSIERGLPTVEGLTIVLRHAQRLLNDHAIAALSHIAGRLEHERVENDLTVRGEIQAESVQLGLAMQHLGALFLELGRTILTLRLGQSPADSFVNTGPAVYISPLGPNPMMVQPFPLQASPLFGSTTVPPLNPGMFGPVGIGRNVNIHIHAVGNRGASNGDGTQEERVNGTGLSNSSAPHIVSVRNIIPGATHSGASNTRMDALSPEIVEINSQIRDLNDSRGGQHQDSSETTGNSTTQNLSVGSFGHLNNIGSGQPSSTENHVVLPECHQVSNNTGDVAASSLKQSIQSSVNTLEDTSNSKNVNGSVGTSNIPLGLGMAGLQPKRRSKQSKSESKHGDDGLSSTTTTTSTDQRQQAVSAGEQILQSLASNISTSGRPNGLEQMMASFSQGNHASPQGQFEVGNVMSRVLQNPGLDRLISGIGSSGGLMNVMEQFTQNPAMSNTLNQIVQQIQQVPSQDTGNTILGRNQGGIDFSGMVRQMMPIISQAINSGVPGLGEQLPNTEPQVVSQDEPKSIEGDKLGGENLQIDLQQVVQIIDHNNPPADIFRAVVETAHSSANEMCPADLVDELCCDEELANDYMEMLRGDIEGRLKPDK